MVVRRWRGLPVIILFFYVHSVFSQVSQTDHWETVVFAGQQWHYFVGTEQPPSNWNQPDFDAGGWAEGPGGFGYGDDDDGTVIPKTLSVYLRIVFNVVDRAAISQVVLSMDYDDGFVAYLNGVEMARVGVGSPGETPAFDQPANVDHEADLYRGQTPPGFELDPEVIDQILNNGENVLAIEVHNRALNSSDLSSNAFLSFGISDQSHHYQDPPEWFEPPFKLESSNLPIVVIDTHGQNIPDDPRIVADMGIIYNGPGQRNYMTDPFNDYEGKISIEIRGESSMMFPKKSYRLETQDSLGNNNNVSLIDMPEENDWVLYAPYSDKSLIRNALTFKLGNELGRWAPRTRFCELILNGDYQGVYLLMEKIKRDKNRVDIAKLKPEDLSGDELTGGYILRIDKTDPDDPPGFTSNPTPQLPGVKSIYFQYYDPKEPELAPEQKEYIKDKIEKFESVLSSYGFSSRTDGYVKYIDVPSFIDFMLINEVGKNVDAYIFSTYLYKKKDSNGGKIVMGPLWDFNLAYGNVDYHENSQYAPGWIYNDTYRVYWFRRLMEDNNFANQSKCRWEELRENILNKEHISYLIDSMVTVLDEAQERNFKRWPVLGEYVWPNQFVGNTYQEEVAWLKHWIAERLIWMNARMPGNCSSWINAAEEPLEECNSEVFPNPFTESTSVRLNADPGSLVQVEITDISGRRIRTLAGKTAQKQTGRFSILWDGCDGQKTPVRPGLYFVMVYINGERAHTLKVIRR